MIQERGRLQPLELTVAPIEVGQEVREEVTEALAGTWAKLRDYAVRLALVVQALRWACGETEQRQIEQESVAAALQLCGYFRAQAGRVYGLASSDRRVAAAERIVNWLTAHPQTQRFRRREMYKHLWRHFGRPEDLEAALTLLEELGYLRREYVGGVGRHTCDWIVEDGWRAAG